MKKLSEYCLVVAAAAVVVMTGLRISMCWRTDAYLDHVSGVWFALAYDLRHGVFYRPLYGPLGYGGTRYAPLVFILLAGLMGVARDPRLAGYALSLLSGILLLSGVYALMRSLGARRVVAASCAILVLAPQAGQRILLDVRGDSLPAALVVWSLTLCAAMPDRWAALAGAAALVTLAFSAKVTSLYAAGTIFLFLLLSGRKSRAIPFLMFVALGVGTVCAAVFLASHGRVYEVMKASAAGGGSWADLIQAPERMAIFMGYDLAILPFFVLATAAVFAWPGKAFQELAPLFFLTAVGATLVIYGSPGTDFNHLLDVQVAATVVIGVWISRMEEKPAIFATQALAMAGLLAIAPSWLAYRRSDVISERMHFALTLRDLGPHPGFILAENPLLPILAHEEPYVLDPFMFRIIAAHDPSFADPLWRMLRERKFSAVVLGKNPNTSYGRWWYSTMHFGMPFVGVLEKYYRPVLHIPGDPVYHTQGETVFLPRRPARQRKHSMGSHHGEHVTGN
jgi:hypothetical protein